MDTRVELVEEAMRVAGARWKPAIMFCLNMMGPQRFMELRRQIPAVSQRMLTLQLRELERDGLVRRVVLGGAPIGVEYRATDLGMSLHPIYRDLCEWAGEHWAAVRKARRAYDRRTKAAPAS